MGIWVRCRGISLDSGALEEPTTRVAQMDSHGLARPLGVAGLDGFEDRHVLRLHQLRTPSGVMPPYTADVLSDEQVRDIYHYLGSLPVSPALKDIPLLSQP
jgi:hypothetical protein